MLIKAFAKINLILNVLGKRADGYHEVEMLMQAIDLCDLVSVEETAGNDPETAHILGPQDFKYGQSDLAYKAALLMAETFRPELIACTTDENGLELAAGVNGIRISVEKHIPAAAGLAGGSADAAAVLTGLGRLWLTPGAEEPPAEKDADELLKTLLPLGAKLGSDVPFCVAAQLGHPAAIAKGRGTELEFVEPTDCGVDLYFSGIFIPDKTKSVYAELKEEDCAERFSTDAFLNARTLEEKRSLMGNHLQAPAERILARIAQKGEKTLQPVFSCNPVLPVVSTFSDPAAPAGPTLCSPSARPSDAMLCGAGPTYFTISDNGRYRTVIL